MATVVFAKEFQKNLNVDGSLKPRAWDLLTKLSTDQDLTGLDLKMPKGARDSRVRTARVTDNHRAVLFAAGTADDKYYVLVAIRPHDDAYEFAAKATMRANPANGVFEVLHDQELPELLTFEESRVSTPDRPLLVPYRAEELEAIGILPELARRAVLLTDEGELTDLCIAAPEWQATALLDLACDVSLDVVKEQYGRDSSGPGTSVIPADFDDPTQLRESLSRSASRMEFVVVEGDEHLRRMLDGDFMAWRTFLHPDQRQLVERPRKGSFRVTGGAGTGKTVVAMHRAVVLATRNPEARILLTTYTKNLANQLKSDLRGLAEQSVLQRIDVSGVDQLARTIVARAGGARTRIMQDQDQLRLWHRAVEDTPDLAAGDDGWCTPHFLKAEYEQVILGMEIRSANAYLDEKRRGRPRLTRVQKTRLWRVVEKFRELLSGQEKTTYLDIAVQAVGIARSSGLPVLNRYDHVIVDEGQDLAAAHWRLLRAVVPAGLDDLFICEDAHQRLYGDRLVISRYGIETRGRSQRLTLNYRTTRQVLGYATRLLAGVDYIDLADEDDSTEFYRSLLVGPEPITHASQTWQEEKNFIVETVRRWLDEHQNQSPGAFAVLVHQVDLRDKLVRELRSAGVPAAVLEPDGTVEASGVQVATMHRAKGTEFARCVVAGVSEDMLPPRWRLAEVDEEQREEIIARDRNLLYVACTRPRDQLVITWTGRRSMLLPPG
ncbi:MULTISPECIES: 3'-5' exonuclease [Amycolatopsis]|uniref:DNA 3'-5' helicase n=1 Tax=Amycolatopsis albidoflavus TaxID=102226 RepID=A0ABW5HVR0_9PSEU